MGKQSPCRHEDRFRDELIVILMTGIGDVRFPSISAIAEKLGVSPAVVSRALHDRDITERLRDARRAHARRYMPECDQALITRVIETGDPAAYDRLRRLAGDDDSLQLHVSAADDLLAALTGNLAKTEEVE